MEAAGAAGGYAVLFVPGGAEEAAHALLQAGGALPAGVAIESALREDGAAVEDVLKRSPYLNPGPLTRCPSLGSSIEPVGSFGSLGGSVGSSNLLPAPADCCDDQRGNIAMYQFYPSGHLDFRSSHELIGPALRQCTISGLGSQIPWRKKASYAPGPHENA